MSAPPIRQHNFSPFGRGDERGTPVYPRGTPLLGEPLSHEINCYWTSYPSAPSHTHQRQITRECTISHRYYTHTHIQCQHMPKQLRSTATSEHHHTHTVRDCRSSLEGVVSKGRHDCRSRSQASELSITSTSRTTREGLLSEA